MSLYGPTRHRERIRRINIHSRTDLWTSIHVQLGGVLYTCVRVCLRDYMYMYVCVHVFVWGLRSLSP